jgi:hypothetical protein
VAVFGVVEALMVTLRSSSLCVGLMAVSLLLPSSSAADSVCVAVDSIPLTTPGGETVVGTLHKRTCHGILERLDGKMRVWVTNDTFQGEALIERKAVLHLLLDDVDLVQEEGGASFGRVLSGTPVLVKSFDGDTVRVRTVEGRVAVEFVTESDAVFPTQQWPRPDAEEEPPPDWPTTDRVVPPVGGRITVDAAGFDELAKVSIPYYSVEEILLDPAMGRIGFEMLEQTDLDARVRLVTPTLWIEGYADALEWREDPPAGGWNPMHGMTPLAPWVPAARQLGSKAAPLSHEPKGRPFGKIVEGARITVNNEEKGWMNVTAAWPGGDVSGWVQKKFVLREGKEEAAKPVPRPLAVVGLWQMARQWEDATGHEEEETEEGVSEVPEPEVDLESVRRQITDRLATLRLLYAGLLARDPTTTGTLTGRVVVDPEGKIIQAHLPEGSLREPGLQKALVAILEGLAFEAREVPRKKRRRKKDEPEVNWNAQIWIQFSFKPHAG